MLCRAELLLLYALDGWVVGINAGSEMVVGSLSLGAEDLFLPRLHDGPFVLVSQGECLLFRLGGLLGRHL
jgi:hypothetical protein